MFRGFTFLATSAMAFLFLNSSSWAQDYANNPIQNNSINSSEVKKYEQKAPASKLTISVWPSASWGRISDSLMQQKGDYNSQAVGADYWLFPNVDIGAFYLHNHSKLHSSVNQTKRHTDTNGIYPFLNFYLLPWLFLQLEGGYSKSSTNGSGIPVSLPLRTYKIHSHQILGMGTINATAKKDLFGLFFQVGYLFTNNLTKAYTASDGTPNPAVRALQRSIFILTEFSRTIPIHKKILKSIVPSIFLGLDRNLNSSSITSLDGLSTLSRGKAGYKAGANLNFALLEKTNLGLHYAHTGGHSGLKTNTFTIDLRVSL